MCRRTQQRRIRELHSAIPRLFSRRSVQKARLLLSCRLGIETQRCSAIQSLERRGGHLTIENQRQAFAIQFRRTAPACCQAMQALFAFHRLRKRPAAFPVAARAIAPKHDRCRRLSKERLRQECYAASRLAVATAASFRFAAADQVTRLSGTTPKKSRS